MFIFENGSIEENDVNITIKGPALNLDKNNFTKYPKIIERIKYNKNSDTIESLNKSINYFFNVVKSKKGFTKESIRSSLQSTSFIL